MVGQREKYLTLRIQLLELSQRGKEVSIRCALMDIYISRRDRQKWPG